MASPVFTAIGIPARRCIVGDAAPRVAAVLDVVVHEKRVVQHFEAGGGGKRILRAATQRARGRDAQRRTQAFARAVDEIFHEPIEVPLRLPRRYAWLRAYRPACRGTSTSRSRKPAGPTISPATGTRRQRDQRIAPGVGTSSRAHAPSSPASTAIKRADIVRGGHVVRSSSASAARHSRTARPVRAADAPARAAATHRGWRGPRPA